MARQIGRRRFLQVVAGLLPAVAVAHAEDSYAGQYLIAEKTHSPLLGKGSPETEHWHFKTAGPQPILRAMQGQEFRFRLFNNLEEEIWLHFYGVRGAASAMTTKIDAGNSNSVEVVFTPPDAGTFWFGPLFKSSRQREMGLTGMLIVDEAADPGFVDVPMIFDDWKISDAGVIDPNFMDLEAAAGEGRLGNWFSLNGALTPRIRLDAEKPTRLRLLNVANTRNMNVQFKGADLLIVARDGQPVRPVSLASDALLLSPGQRADLVLTQAQDEITVALSLLEDAAELAFLMGGKKAAKGLPADFSLPANPLPTVDISLVPRVVALTLEGGIKGGMVSARVGTESLDMRTMLERGLAWAMNGVAGPSGVALFEAQKGEALILEIDNKTKFEQPLHIHGHVWHLLALDGLVVDGQSWRDTGMVPALSKARFLFVADNPGAWAIHSLIAERADAGLFGGFTVADMP